MEPHEIQCFIEEVKKDQLLTLEYQVIYGGQVGKLDIDVSIEDPNGDMIVEDKRERFKAHELEAKLDGVYTVCFSNKFSTVSGKTVYFDLFLDEGHDALDESDTKQTAITRMGSICVKIKQSLRMMHDYQTHHRNNEITGRNIAEDLNSNVKVCSFLQSLMMIVVAMIQVYMVRKLFDVKR